MLPPLIVSARLAPDVQASLDALRARYFPPQRNHLAAHLTLLHAVPPERETDLHALLVGVTQAPPPAAQLTGLMPLGRGFAVRVQAPELARAHKQLQQALWPVLTAQDRQPWRPHVTLQNKVEPAEAAAACAEAAQGFAPASSRIVSLRLWRYQGGPWSFVGAYPFQGMQDA